MVGSDEVTVVDAERDQFSFGRYQNVIVAVWYGHGTGPAVARLGEVVRKVSAECPLGFSAVQLIREGTGLPDADARAGFQRLMADYARELACLAVVVGGDGFWASAVRAAVTSIWQTVTHNFEMRVCGTCEEAGSWLPARHLDRTGTSIDPARLSAVLRAARDRVDTTSAGPG